MPADAERRFLRGAREYHAALRSGETTPKVQSTATSIDSQMAAVEPEPVGGKVAETSKSVTRKVGGMSCSQISLSPRCMTSTIWRMLSPHLPQKSAQLESCERGAIDPSPGPEYVPAWYAKQFVAMKEKYQDDDTTRNVEVQHTPARAPIPTITEAEEEELRHGLVCVLREPDFAPKPITKGGAEGLHNREECAAGVAEKAGITAQVEHLATGEEHADTETA